MLCTFAWTSYQPLNDCILGEVHPLPKVITLMKNLAQLAGVQVLSKLDANCRFWEIPLSENSRILTPSSPHLNSLSKNQPSEPLKRVWQNPQHWLSIDTTSTQLRFLLMPPPTVLHGCVYLQEQLLALWAPCTCPCILRAMTATEQCYSQMKSNQL